MRRWLLIPVLACLAAAPPPAVGPKSVTLDGALTLQEAFKQLEAQSGNPVIDLRPFQGQEATDPRLSLNLKNSPFWAAADAVAAQAHLRLLPCFRPGTQTPAVGFLTPAGHGTAPALAYSGPFRLAVKRTTAVLNGEDDSLSHLTVVLEVAWEPRLQPLWLKIPPDAFKGVTKPGEPARPADQGGVGTVKLLGEPSVEVPVRLPRPPRGVARLPRLEGTLIALVPPGALQFEVPAAAGQHQEIQGVALRVERVEADARAGEWRVAVHLRYPAGQLDLESHQSWVIDGHQATLVGPDGTTFAAGAPREVSVEEGGGLRAVFPFARVRGRPADFKLAYRAPMAPQAHPLQFAFSDLPLP